ncbi:hypothetical protein LCGC14_3164910, partial [marine sediment metagenome]
LKLWSIRGGKENFHAMVDVFTRTEIEHVSSEIYTPESIKRQGPAEKVNTSPLPEKFMNYMMLKMIGGVVVSMLVFQQHQMVF